MDITTKYDALEYLSDLGGHDIVLNTERKEIEAIGKIFNFTPFWETFTPDPNVFKGPLPLQGQTWGDSYEGCDAGHLLWQVLDSEKLPTSGALGRGFAYRQNIKTLSKAITGE